MKATAIGMAGFYGWQLTALRVGVSLILPLIAGGLTLLALRFINVS